MAKITKDTLIVDCLKLNPNSAEILQSVGMHCIGCAMAHGETIEEAVSFTATTSTSCLKSSTKASNKLSGKRRCAAFRFFRCEYVHAGTA